MKFSLTIAKVEINKTYQQILLKTAKTAKIKGFRPGKAPLDLVEASVDQAKIYEQVLNELLPPAYLAYIKKHDLHPITLPKVTIKEAEPDSDWLIEVEIAEKPEVKLGDYQKAISNLETPKKIYVPGEKKVIEAEEESKRLNQIFDILLKTCSVAVPELLIDEEVSHRLSNLMYQIDKLGLNLDSYTASLNKTTEQLKKEYRIEAEAALKLEFILDAIAKDQKLQANAEEVNAFIEKIEDPQVKEQIKAEKGKFQDLAIALTKRKVTDYLLNLTVSPIILAK